MPVKNPPMSVPDCLKIYRLAECYWDASSMLDEQARRDEWGCAGPKLLVDSFAVELYLKCLYVLDTNKVPPCGHDLLNLFEALNSATKSLIREAFDRSVRDHPILSNLSLFNPEAVKTTDFKRALEAARDTFVKRRYLYENLPKREWFYAHILGDAIRSVTKLDLRICGADSAP